MSFNRNPNKPDADDALMITDMLIAVLIGIVIPALVFAPAMVAAWNAS